jgi:hypothetical protein
MIIVAEELYVAYEGYPQSTISRYSLERDVKEVKVPGEQPSTMTFYGEKLYVCFKLGKILLLNNFQVVG